MSIKNDEKFLLIYLLKNPTMFQEINSVIRGESFYETELAKLCHKTIKKFYKISERNLQRPSLDDLSIVLDDKYSEPIVKENSSVTIEQLKEVLVLLFQQLDKYNEEILTQRVVEFIRNEGIMRVILDQVVESYKRHNQIQNQREVVDSLCTYAQYNISPIKAHTLEYIASNPSEFRPDNGSGYKIIKSSMDIINNSLTVEGYTTGDLTVVVAATGVGKSSFMVQEGQHAASQGMEVLHVIIGDMIKWDSFVRYSASAFSIEQKMVSRLDNDRLQEQISRFNQNQILNRITVIEYAANEITVSHLISDITKLQNALNKHFDMIIVDYADNLIQESEMMFEGTGDIYISLAKLAKQNKAHVMVASQPKPAYWSLEVLPVESANASSIKQNTVDTMITIGKLSRESEYGSLFVPKVRRGVTGSLQRVKLDLARCRFLPVTEEDYEAAKASLPVIANSQIKSK